MGGQSDEVASMFLEVDACMDTCDRGKVAMFAAMTKLTPTCVTEDAVSAALAQFQSFSVDVLSTSSKVSGRVGRGCGGFFL